MFTYNGTFPRTDDRGNRSIGLPIVTYHNLLSVNTTGPQPRGVRQRRAATDIPTMPFYRDRRRRCFYPNTSDKPPDDIVSHTQWFHDHIEHATAFNVYHGLAGLYLFKDPKDALLNLPSGAADIPLVITDKLFNADNSLNYPFPGRRQRQRLAGRRHPGQRAPQPRLEVERRKYRFRVLNAGDARNIADRARARTSCSR